MTAGFFRAAWRTLLYLLTVSAGAVLLAEISLRTVLLDSQTIQTNAFRNKIMIRIAGHWRNDANQDPFLPPFTVFSDENFDDPGRLRTIFEKTRLPPSQSWQSYDFLVPEDLAERTAYSITSNSLGFRGKEQARKKDPGTFRIIALGSYHVFGHAVNDHEAYPARLEEALNGARPRGIRRFEVWNGGRHAATAIVGLARLKHEIFAYQPDLLIFDYGFVDPLVLKDDVMIAALHFPDTGGFALLKSGLSKLHAILQASVLYTQALHWLTRLHYQKNVANFAGALRAMIDEARAHGVPVVLVKQLPARLDPGFFAQFISSDVDFIDVLEVFKANRPSRSAHLGLRRRATWLDEVPPEIRREPLFRFAPYLADVFQLNPAGHQILSDALAAKILAGIGERTP